MSNSLASFGGVVKLFSSSYCVIDVPEWDLLGIFSDFWWSDLIFVCRKFYVLISSNYQEDSGDR